MRAPYFDTAAPVADALEKARRAVLMAAFLGWMFDGVEMGVVSIVARPAMQDLLGAGSDQQVGPWIAKVTALFLLGAASGGLVFGWLGDRIGRVRALIASIITYSLFTGLTALAVAPWHFGLFRFIAALGMGGEWSLGVALVMECWPEKSRVWLAGAIGAASNVGFALIALVAMKFVATPQTWRPFMLAGLAPALLALYIQSGVPESKRWQDAVRERVAHPLREISRPPLLGVTLLAILMASVALLGTWGSVQWIPSWVDKMTGGEMPEAKAVAQLVSSIGAIVGCFLGAWLASRVGRRPAYTTLCVLSLGLCAYLFRTFDHYSASFLVVVGLVGLVTASFYGWLPLYLPELFPTRVRATGQGISFNFGRILAAMGVLYTGELVKLNGGSYARAGAMISLVYIIGMVVVWFAPETRGRELE